MKTKYIGIVHPQYFLHSPIFRNFDKVETNNGLKLRSSMMTMVFKDEHLFCENEEVLDDFTILIKENYGASLSWSEAYKMIVWESVPDYVRVINFGNVVLKDDFDSGWDGSINAIWYNDEVPGEIVKLYHRIWINGMLLDTLTMKLDDIKDLPKEEVVNNLVVAKLFKMEDNAEKLVVDKLLKDYLKWHILSD